MKNVTVWQSRYIDGDGDGHAASAEFNELMQEIAELNPKWERDGKTFWVFWKVERTEPETIVEEHEAAGEKAHCIDCPYIMRDLNRFGNIDARKKWATCGKTGERTNIESRACEIYHSLSVKERRRF